jgi:8-oxo-dGTP pyrophosphatase MutT (NUDIX family)
LAGATQSVVAGLPADWRARLRRSLPAQPDHHPAQSQPGPQPAAVLLPIVDRTEAPTLLLTTRAGHLRQHAGQISFPGGRIEHSDLGVLAAALRETREEIGIDDRFIEPLGFLPDYVVRTGFRITPVVALISPGFTLRVDAAEVAEVFEMPLEIPYRPENFRPTRRVLHGVEVVLNDLNFEGRVIWGATAAILQALCAALRGEA